MGLWGDGAGGRRLIGPASGEIVGDVGDTTVFAASHYVASQERMAHAMGSIEEELGHRLKELESPNKLLEAQRLRMRPPFDLEMMREMGFCSGSAKYSR